MKDLLTATKLRDQIVKLDKDIISLESSLDALIEHESCGKVSFIYNKHKKPNEATDKDEMTDALTGFIMAFSRGMSKNDGSQLTNNLELELSANELIITMASLLNYKKEERKNLVNEFNNLSIKLKI